MYFDSHCHLSDERLREQVPDVLARAREADVLAAVTIASDLDDARQAMTLAATHDGLWATAGVHPHAADGVRADTFGELTELLSGEHAVAVGETGLDFHYDNSPRQTQRRVFDRHLQLAADLDLPVVVHARDADEDVIAAVRQAAGSVRGVLHCFASGAALLDAGLEADWYVSFSGLVTFRSFGGADLVAAVPEERLLIETDSPYLAPVPMRGRTNEPAYVVYVAHAVAGLRGVEQEHIARVTADNAFRFYGLDPAWSAAPTEKSDAGEDG